MTLTIHLGNVDGLYDKILNRMAPVVCDGCGDVDLAGAGGQLEKP